MRKTPTAQGELAIRLDAAADLPRALGWTLRAALVPAERILGDAVNAGERVIPILCDAATGEVHASVAVDDEEAAGIGIAHILATWAEHVERCPGRIDVDSASLAAELRLLLSPLDVLVRHTPTAPSDDASDLFLAELERAFAERLRASPDQVHAHRTALLAAVEFHAAQPWRVVTRLDPVLFEAGLGPSGPAVAIVDCVEDDVTILLLPRADIAWGIAAGKEYPNEHDGVWMIDFPPLAEMDVFDRFAWRRSEFPRTANRRFPRLRRVDRSRDESDPTARDIDIPGSFVVATALSALARIDDAIVDQGRWTVEVAVTGATVAVTMSWADAQSPPTEATWLDRGVPSDRLESMPRLVLLDRRRHRRSQETPADVQATLDDELLRSVGSLTPVQVAHELESSATTPLERADAMWAKALLTHGRARRRLLERAAECSPDCVGAWRARVEFTTDPHEIVRWLREAVAAGDRLRALPFAEVPVFIPHQEMADEALRRLAMALRDVSDEPGALQAAREALARQPENGFGRSMLAGLLVSLGESAEALELVRDRASPLHGAESHGVWVRAVAGFLVNGDTPWVRSAIATAVEANIVTAHAILDPRLLAAQQDPLPTMSRYTAEAALALRELRPAIAERATFRELLREAIAAYFKAQEKRPVRHFKQRKTKKR